MTLLGSQDTGLGSVPTADGAGNGGAGTGVTSINGLTGAVTLFGAGVAIYPGEPVAQDIEVEYPTYNVQNPHGATPAAVGDGVANDTAIIQAWITVAALTGGVVLLPPGIFRIEPGVLQIANTNGVHLRGSGRYATRVFIDDTLGNAGSYGVWFNNTYSCSERGITWISTTNRTAGDAIKISGGNFSPPGNTAAFADVLIEKTNYDKQFNCVNLQDTAATGSWVLRVRNCFASNCSQGGVPFLINSQHGGSQYLEDLYVTGGTTAATGPFAAVQIMASGDFSLDHVSTILCEFGLYLGGGAAATVVAAGEISNCFFDTNSSVGVVLSTIPGQVIQQVTFNNVWVANAPGALYYIDSTAGGTIDDVAVNGGRGVLNTEGWGFILKGVTNVRISDVSLTGCALGGYLIQNGSQKISIRGGYIGTYIVDGAPTPIGVQINAGSCTTGGLILSDVDMTEVTVSKVIDQNIQATPMKVNTRVIDKFTGSITPTIATPTFAYMSDGPFNTGIGTNDTVEKNYPTSQRLAYRLRVTIQDNVGTTFTVTLYKNGAPTALVLSIPSGSTPGEKFQQSGVIGNVIYSDGDDYDLRIDYPEPSGEDGAVRLSAQLEEIPGLWN